MMNVFLVVLLILFGIALMLLEMFFIPGFGAAGFFSVVSCVAAVALAYVKISAEAGHIALFAVIILLVLAIWLFLSGRTLDKMSLKTEVSDKIDLTKDVVVKPGDRVITSSRLAPMGKVRLGEQEYEAKSTGDFIDQETIVEIVRIEGNVIVVKPIK